MKTNVDQKKHQRFNGDKGNCICPECGERIAHERGVRCQSISCPKCGTTMYREGSYHHRQWLRKHKDSKE